MLPVMADDEDDDDEAEEEEEGEEEEEAEKDEEDNHSQSSFERGLLSPPSSDDDGEEHASATEVPSTTQPRPPTLPLTTRTKSQPVHQRPLYKHASRSQSYLGPSTFAPPFYNRPPTPLPPSPSLTSLLRPPFSAHPSRPTTPDSSDTEATGTTGVTGTNSTAATINASARAATTVPRASPKVPTYEYYGFVLYLGSSLAFLVYLLWSYLPTPFLHKIGVYYYPNRWWALAVPSWIVVLVIYIYVALASYNRGYMTLKLDSLECLVDEASDVAAPDFDGRILRAKDRKGGKWRGPGPAASKPKDGRRKGGDREGGLTQLDWRRVWGEGTDAVLDVPWGGVCEVLYGSTRADDGEYE